MNWQRIGAIVLLVAVILFVLLTAVVMKTAHVESGITDPAIEFYTKTHSTGYGGVDQWAYYGMKEEIFAARLNKEGYDCRSSRDDGADDKPDGIHKLLCHKDVIWPLSRTLLIKARVDGDVRGRLAGANASSSLAADAFLASKILAGVLRKAGWIEPDYLQIRGFEIDSVDTLTRFAVDALATAEWNSKCKQFPTAITCVELAQQRRESGFPALPQGAVAVGDAMAIQADMERIRLMPLVPRYADSKPADSLIVRVANEQMWLDFISKDMAGRELMVSIALDSEGGAPARLVAKLGGESREVPLAGTHRLTNNGEVKYLVPEAGLQNPRFSIWLDLPSKDYPVTFQRLAAALPNADPVFVPRIVRAVIANISATNQPEEALGLYSVLRTIERRADMLRLAHAESWLPAEQSMQLVKQAYRDDPVTRGAWALAMCESAMKPPVIDEVCWLRFTELDTIATDLMRSEVVKLQVLYAVLGPTHPLRLRLERLSEVLFLYGTKTGSGDV